jgi:hypothetical protein
MNEEAVGDEFYLPSDQETTEAIETARKVIGNDFASPLLGAVPHGNTFHFDFLVKYTRM